MSSSTPVRLAPPALWALILPAIVWLLSALSVDIGAKVLGVLLAIELISLVIVGIVAITGQRPRIAAHRRHIVGKAAGFSPTDLHAAYCRAGAG